MRENKITIRLPPSLVPEAAVSAIKCESKNKFAMATKYTLIMKIVSNKQEQLEL